MKLIKAFQHHHEYIQQFADSSQKIKKHIAQDIDKTNMDDLCYMIQLFKSDPAFSKYLLSKVLEKMHEQGAKCDYDSFIVALLNSLHHTEYLEQMVDTLLSYERFLALDREIHTTYKMLTRIHELRLYEHP